MKLYITGSYSISPNFNAGSGPDFSVSSDSGQAYFQAVEPDYKSIIDPKISRRMSRIIKMSIAATNKSLEEAKVSSPGAIIVGTGLGCLQDTEKFLSDVIENRENLPSPTAFIQSTHNTIAGQIALVLNCYAHNFTFVQRDHSFECALEDAFLQIEEGIDNILVGGVDEITPSVFKILNRLDCVKLLTENPGKGISHKQKSVLGEGASFFVVSGQKTSSAKACVEGMDYFYIADSVESVEIRMMKFLESINMGLSDVSAIMLGKNGDQQDDKIFDSIGSDLFTGITTLSFKNICGEYFTSTAFGVYLASEILHSGKIPDEVLISGSKDPKLSNILLYNQHNNNYHTFILLSACQPL